MTIPVVSVFQRFALRESGKTTLLRSKPWLPRLIRRLGGISGAPARRELHMPDLAGYKLMLVFFEKKGYKTDALDRRLIANRRHEAVSRRPGETL